MMCCRSWLRFCVVFMVVALLVLAGPLRAASLQEEFDAICIHTQGAEGLSIKKLQGLISQSDKLREAIEKSNNPKKKVLLFRLNKCRNFFEFMVETKQKKKAAPAP